MLRKRCFLLLIGSMLMAAGSQTSSASTIFVKTDGTGDGSSWTSPLGSLDDALDKASAGDEIWIAKGTYKPSRLANTSVKNSYSFIIKEGVSLYGGFAGTETDKAQRELASGGRPWEFVNETVLSGDDDVPDVWQREIAAGTTYRNTWVKESNQVPGTAGNSTHVLYQAEQIKTHTVIDGLTIKGGNANQHKMKCSGGGIYAIGDVSIRSCRFYENSCWLRNETVSIINSMGGAVFLNGAGSASVTDCHFARNYSNSSYNQGIGGGLWAQNARVSGCLFEDCVGEDGGGAVYLSGGSLRDCEVRCSYGSSGGGIYAIGVLDSSDNVIAPATVDDVTVYDCQGLVGGGITVATGATLTHARVYACKADGIEFGDSQGGSGGGIMLQGGTARGCVAYNNMAFRGAGLCIRSGKAMNCTLQHNANRKNDVSISNLAEWPDSGALPGVTNTIGNPDAEAANFTAPSSFVGLPADAAQLASLADADWSLAPGSPFIDAGTGIEGSETTDMAGNPRVMGSSIDVGAYEYKTQQKPAAVLTFDGQKEKVTVRFVIAEGDIKFEVGDQTYRPEEVKPNTNKAVELPLEGTTTVKIFADALTRLNLSEQGLSAIDLSGAPHLTMLQVPDNALTALNTSANPKLTGIYASGNKIDSLDLSANTALRVLSVSDNNIGGVLDLSHIASLSSVDADNNRLEGLLLPAGKTLYEVNCENNLLTSLDIAGHPGLTSLNIYGNRLTSIDLTGLSALESLYAGLNQISEVKGLTDCKAIETLNLSGNRLSHIDISVVPTVTGLYLYDNELTELDLSGNASISWMNVNNNHISKLDVSRLTNLRLLHACNNQIEALDVTNAPYLSQLTAGNNRLTSLDVSKQTGLFWLKVDSNEISKLDLANNGYLSLLECGHNKIDSLDVSKCLYLRRLSAECNLLTSIDVSTNTSLCGIEIQGNQFAKDALDALIAALPDVKDQHPVEGSEWISRLDISDMPGTAQADIAPAIAKGWNVIAETSGIGGIGAVAEAEIVSASYWSLDGRPLAAPQGICIMRATLSDGRTVARKVVIHRH